jgi:hypothetical protein
MSSDKNKDLLETHPLFPSGDWEGFYTYTGWAAGYQEKMAVFLNFKDNVVEGGGSDPVGAFTWRGTYDKVEMRCTMTKYYASHQVHYEGRVDENGIWGQWSISDHWKGGFHIWPKPGAENAVAVEMSSEFRVLSSELR